MKNNRYTYYILLPAVFFIWGLIIYKFVARDNDKAGYSSLDSNPEKELIIPSTEYKLLLNYPNPFFPQKESTNKDMPRSGKTKRKKTEQQYQWADIQYNGFVENKEKEKVHVTINKKNILLSLNDTFENEYTLLRITNDSILIKYKKYTKWIKKHS